MKSKVHELYDWDTVDWGDSNRVIAGLLGCCKGSVYHQRKKRFPEEYAERPQVPARPPVKAAWVRIDWSKSNVALAAELKCSRETILKHRWRLAPSTVDSRRSYDWSAVDWNRSVWDIAEGLGCTANAVRYQKANRTNEGKA